MLKVCGCFVGSRIPHVDCRLEFHGSQSLLMELKRLHPSPYATASSLSLTLDHRPLEIGPVSRPSIPYTSPLCGGIDRVRRYSKGKACHRQVLTLECVVDRLQSRNTKPPWHRTILAREVYNAAYYYRSSGRTVAGSADLLRINRS